MAVRYGFFDYFGRVFLCALGIAGVVAGIAIRKNYAEFIGWIFLALGLWLLLWNVYCIVRMTHGGNKRCKNCGRWFADELVKSVEEGSYKTTKTVSHDIRDSKGNRTGSYDQTVPATAYYGTNYWRCIYCGNKRKEEYTHIH